MGKRPKDPFERSQLSQGARQLRGPRQGQAAVIRQWLVALLALVAALAAAPAGADDFRPAYLQLAQSDATHYDVMWKVPALGENAVLKVHPAFPPGTATVTRQHRSYANGVAV